MYFLLQAFIAKILNSICIAHILGKEQNNCVLMLVFLYYLQKFSDCLIPNSERHDLEREENNSPLSTSN